jgi:Pyridoxamine 5'-phosphate oxidase
MPNREPIETTNLDTGYGLDPLPWTRPRDLLAVGAFAMPGKGCFLGTVRPDGRPHSAALGGAWHDGDFYFQCGPDTRKARNIAANPACTLSASLEGIDLVVEGDAERVTDTPTLEALAAVYRKGGWPVEVDGDSFTAPFSAPSAGPPPWHLFRLTPHTAFGVATAEPYGATRWRF